MSMFKKGLLVAGFGLGAALMSGGQAGAAPANNGDVASALIVVSASVSNNCNFAADGAIAFGAYNAVTGNAGTANLLLNCTNGAVLNVDIDDGANPVAGGRTMDGGTTTPLAYSLCQDSTADFVCNTPWGTQTGGSTLLFTGTGADAPVVVNGLIAGGQNVVSSLSYTDTVNILVDY